MASVYVTSMWVYLYKVGTREHMLVGLPLYYLRPRALGTAPGPGICASFQNGNTVASVVVQWAL
jgi:hypothetical protein